MPPSVWIAFSTPGSFRRHFGTRASELFRTENGLGERREHAWGGRLAVRTSRQELHARHSDPNPSRAAPSRKRVEKEESVLY